MSAKRVCVARSSWCSRYLPRIVAAALAIQVVFLISTSEVWAADAATPINERADGYRGIWYSVGSPRGSIPYKYSGGLGTYCAKHSPFAVYCPEVNKTFFCYGGATADSNTHLVHMVSYYDHATGTVPRPVMVVDKQTGDAHDNPVISVDDEGYLWLFSTSHGRGRPSYVHRSAEPYSIEDFHRIEPVYDRDGERVPLDNFSYWQVWHVPEQGFVAFYTRYGDPAQRTNMFLASRDGELWTNWQRLAAIESGHYQASCATAEKAATAFNMHPKGKGLDGRTNLYYLETPDRGQTWRTVDGTAVELPLTERTNPALVHDYAAEGRNVYLKSLQFDRAGRPVIFYLTSGGHESGPENGPREWCLAHWLGDEWRYSVVTTSDNNYDMGSLYIEDGQWRIIAPTLPGPQAYNTGGEMAMWISRDEGRSWQMVRQLTGDSPMNHTYARRPVDAHPDFYALWADGHGRRPSESRLYFCNIRGDVFRLPTQMSQQFVRPEKVIGPGG